MGAFCASSKRSLACLHAWPPLTDRALAKGLEILFSASDGFVSEEADLLRSLFEWESKELSF